MMPGNDRIDGWREIATYLNRDERTAKRWEKQRGLPIRRIPGDGRANVYLLRHELEAWLNGRVAAEAGALPAATLEDDAAERPAKAAEGGTPDGTSQEPFQADDQDEVVVGDEAASRIDEPLPSGRADRTFRPREHVSLLVSMGGLLLLLTVTAMRFFHMGPIESTMFASETSRQQPQKALPDTEVDRLYLQGMYLCEERTPRSLERARSAFAAAIARDPTHAPSYGGLAKTYLLLREYAMTPQDEAYSKAEAAASRALELDPKLAPAHAALGFIRFFWQWRPAEAEQEFGRALELDGSSALAHHWYGSMLMHQGRYREAEMQLDLAQHLHPASAAILASRALAIGFGGRREEGLQLLHSIGDTEMDAPVVHRDIALLSLLAPADTRTYLREMTRFAEMRQDTAGVDLLTEAAATLANRGESAMWAGILQRERREHPDRPAYLMAEAEAALGNSDAAMHMLHRLADLRDPQMMGLVVDPQFASLRNQAEFERIAERLGLSLPVMAKR